MYQTCIDPIGCPTVERKAYIFFCDKKVNKCIGEFIEQENDAGETQWLFKMYWDQIDEYDIQMCSLPGIDLTLHSEVYVRSYDEPYFMECCTIPNGRGDLKWYLDRVGMTYNDKFEFMLRYRAVTHHSNTYLGRTPYDKIDRVHARDDSEYYRKIIPNLNVSPENEYHEILSID